jgi:hypothetical protein
MPARKKTSSRTRSHRAAGRRPRRSAARKKVPRSRKRYWSGHVTRTSHAMDTKPGVFKSSDPDKIARSLLRSARRSHTRKTTPYQSAMSLLNFYENRGGRNLGSGKKRVLERAKESLRAQAGRSKGKKKASGRGHSRRARSR